MLSSTGIVIGLLGLLWYMVAGPGTTACLLDASGRGSTHLPSKKPRGAKKKIRRREDGKAAMDPPTSCLLVRLINLRLNCDIVKLLRSTVNVAIWFDRSCLVDVKLFMLHCHQLVFVYRHKRRRYLYRCRREATTSSGTCVPDMLEVANLTCKLCCCCKLCSTVI